MIPPEGNVTVPSIEINPANLAELTNIRAHTAALASVSPNDFDRLLLPFQKSGLKKRIEFIEMAFGLNLTWDKAVALTYVFKKVKVCKGQFVFKEHEQCNGFYIIKSGDILVIVLSIVSL